MASSSRLYHLTSSFLLLRGRRNASLLSSPFPSSLVNSSSSFHLRSIRLLPSSILRPLRFYSGSSAVSVEEEGSAASPPPLHTWPEWDQFVEKLQVKGYFERTEEDGTAAVSESPAGDSVSLSWNQIKTACIKFARDRFDILKSLPKEHIQSVLSCGCPNLHRKAVNSAKRLRAFVRLDEGDVCGACNLRGSCDRAYVIAKEDDAARTVDIMRILMCYALDPVHQSVRENPSIKESFQVSARKLIAELIKLSDTNPEAVPPTPVVRPPGEKKPSQKVNIKIKQSQNVEMKRGDWLCPKCSFLNFARNLRCLECKEDGPKRVDLGAEMKLGDWTCPQCEFMNFARNKKCFRCMGPRPEREMNPGEWECPSCVYLNFKRNKVCKKCNCERPADDVGNRLEDHMWRKPKQVKENENIKFGDDEEDDEENSDDEDDDILPMRGGENKFVTSKRATPSERRLTAARKRNYPSF